MDSRLGNIDRISCCDKDNLIESCLKGDVEAREKLILEGTHLVDSIITSKFLDNKNIIDDLYSVAYLAVINAVDDLNSTGYRYYYTFLKRRIITALEAYLDDNNKFIQESITQNFVNDIACEYENKEFVSFIDECVFNSDLSFGENCVIDKYFGFSSNPVSKKQITSDLQTYYKFVVKKMDSGLAKIQEKINTNYFFDDYDYACYLRSQFYNRFSKCKYEDYQFILGLLAQNERNLLLKRFPLKTAVYDYNLSNEKLVEASCIAAKLDKYIDYYYCGKYDKILKGLSLKYNVSCENFYDYFPTYSAQQVDYAVNCLTDVEKELVFNRYCGNEEKISSKEIYTLLIIRIKVENKLREIFENIENNVKVKRI